MRYFVFDIDNCISDDMHRRGTLANEGYDAYHAKSIHDAPANVHQIIAAREKDASIIWLTGRTIKYREITENWLVRNDLWGRHDALLMRKNGDFRSSPEFKCSVLNKHLSMNGIPHSNIIICFDDRADIVEAYRAAGFTAEVLAVHGAEHFVKPRQPEPSSKPSRRPDAILDEMAATFRERNAGYADNYKKFGKLAAALFPDGVPPELLHSNEFGIYFMMMVKMSRLANDINHADSARDIGVYAAMLESLILENAG